MSKLICPACDAEMFGWATGSPRPAYGRGGGETLINRCEACGLGTADGGADLARLEDGTGQVRAPNRGSLQAALGARGWALIERDRKLYPTPAAAEPIAARLGGSATRVRTPLAGEGLWGMWQTLVNAFTLGDNVLTDLRRGRHSPATGRQRAALGLDLVVSLLVALPLFVLAVVLESLAALIGRGGIVSFRLER